MSFNFDALARTEAAWAAAQEAKTLAALMPVYERALESIYAKVATLPPGYKLTRLQTIQQQLEEIANQFQAGAESAAEKAVAPIMREAAGRAIQTRNAIIESMGDLKPLHAKTIADLPSVIPHAAVKHLATLTGMDAGVLGQELRRAAYGELSQSILLGESTAKQVARLKAVIPIEETGLGTKKAYRSRLETISRTTTAGARSAGTQEAHAALNKRDPGSVKFEMIVESIRKTPDTNNHYFSFAAHGVVRRLSEPFRVSVGDVEAAKDELRTLKSWKTLKGGGIFWAILNGFYQGASLPAHYNDRGTIIAWAPDWHLPGISPKHPELSALLGAVA